MMTKMVRLVLATILTAGLVLFQAPPASAQDTTTLRFNRWVPVTHHFHARILAGWAERVEKATQGRVKVEFTPASLGAPARQFELAVSGVADLTSGNQSYTPERFVASRVAELPFLGDSAEGLSVAQWRVQERYLEKANEYKGTKLLGLFNNGASEIFTTKKPIKSLADLKGLKIRGTPGVGTEVANALEVVQVNAPITEVYEMLSRGIADGALLSPDSARSFQLDRSLRFQTPVPGGLYNSAFFLVMNEAKWNALPKPVQEAIMSVSGEAVSREAGRIWDDQQAMANAAFAKSGMQLARFSDAELNDIRKRLSPIEENWLKQAAERGVDGAAALAMLRRESARKP
jgi:TRAP-type C4-dicarboxylate transport system substrate-binding protein